MIRALLQSVGNFSKIYADRRKSPAALRAYQHACIKATLQFAGKKIPYYRRLWRELGIDLLRIRRWEDFRGIPLLSKQEVRSRQPEEFLPDGTTPWGLWRSQTTGSTGIPIVVYRSPQTEAWNKA